MNAHVAEFAPFGLRLKFEGQDKFSEAKRLFGDSKHDVGYMTTLVACLKAQRSTS